MKKRKLRGGMMKTPEEIKKGLEVCQYPNGCKECPYEPDAHCVDVVMLDALAYIQQLEERCKTLEYTLLGVMHSVDKWLSVEPYDFEKDDGTVAATRASEAREVALTAIENLQTRLAQVERERDAAVEDLREASFCGDCFHYDVAAEKEPCVSCLKRRLEKPNWQWRGVYPENTKEDEENAD